MHAVRQTHAGRTICLPHAHKTSGRRAAPLVCCCLPAVHPECQIQLSWAQGVRPCPFATTRWRTLASRVESPIRTNKSMHKTQFSRQAVHSHHNAARTFEGFRNKHAKYRITPSLGSEPTIFCSARVESQRKREQGEPDGHPRAKKNTKPQQESKTNIQTRPPKSAKTPPTCKHILNSTHVITFGSNLHKKKTAASPITSHPQGV